MTQPTWLERQMRRMRAIALGAVLVVLPACSGGDTDGDAALEIADGDDGELGSVNLSRPDWLPDDFPLPRDARIHIRMNNGSGDPPVFHLQARTHAQTDRIVADLMRWAQRNGLQPREVRLPNPANRVVSFAGRGSMPSNVQIMDEEGRFRHIAVSIVGPPWR